MKLYTKYISGTAVTLLISITVLLGYQYMKQSSETVYKTNIIHSKTLEQQNNLTFVTAIGRIEPRTKVVHLTASPAVEGARLAQLLVKEGDYVKPGQVVATLDSEQRLQSVVVEAEQQVEVSRAKLAQVEAGVKVGEIAAQEAVLQRLEAEQQHAVSELERTERLYKSGDIAEYELNNRKLAITTIAKE
ncbi:MAG: biotin/lipoyl-binding protein, partial [Blastocatellia bacterium]|nr:biotin/lipoyl-binding protein [Blastocatellia bacterium]